MWRLLVVAYMKRVVPTQKNLGVNTAALFTFDTCLGRCSTNKAVNWHDKQVSEGKKKGKPVCVFLTPVRSCSVTTCPRSSCQSPLYSKQIAFSVAGIQLPLTSTAATQNSGKHFPHLIKIHHMLLCWFWLG